MNAESRTNPAEAVLSIIMVSAVGVRELVLQALRSIAERAPGLPLEVIVVDNASGDGTVVAIREHFPDVIIMENAENVGFAPANNQALAIARGRYVLFLNPDTEVGPGTLQRCVDELERDPAVGMVGCRLMLADGTVQYESARRDYTVSMLVWESLWLHMLRPHHPRFAAHLMGDWDHRGNRDVEAISGAFMMVRRSVAQQLGGLPQDVFMYHEDLSFCLCVRRAGWRIRFLGDVETMHHCGQSSKRSNARLGLLEGEVKVRLVREKYGVLHAAAARGVLTARSVLRIGVAVVGYMPGLGRVRERYPRVFHLQAHALLLAWCLAPALVRPLMPRAPAPSKPAAGMQPAH